MSGSDELHSNPEVPAVVRSIRARQAASISEVESASTPPKVDLAQAIVSLARAGERRRGARADLIASTDTVAKAIRKQLRSGDQVVVRSQARAPLVAGLPVTYIASRVHSGAAKWADVLLREGAILGLPEDSDSGVRMVWQDDYGLARSPATADARAAFVAEAEIVIQAFRDLLDSQAVSYGESAKKVTKLTPR